MRTTVYPENPRTFGQRIRKIRMDKGLKLLEYANQHGITEGYLSRIENDKQFPSLLVIMRLTGWSFQKMIACLKKTNINMILFTGSKTVMENYGPNY